MGRTIKSGQGASKWQHNIPHSCHCMSKPLHAVPAITQMRMHVSRHVCKPQTCACCPIRSLGGDRLLDWSYAGYMAGEAPIPDLPIAIDMLVS
jgi:hypothetical protein